MPHHSRSHDAEDDNSVPQDFNHYDVPWSVTLSSLIGGQADISIEGNCVKLFVNQVEADRLKAFLGWCNDEVQWSIHIEPSA